VVEDEDGIRSLIASVLRGRQYEVVEAASASAALQCLSAGHYDLIVLDLMLGSVSGGTSSMSSRNEVSASECAFSSSQRGTPRPTSFGDGAGG